MKIQSNYSWAISESAEMELHRGVGLCIRLDIKLSSTCWMNRVLIVYVSTNEVVAIHPSRNIMTQTCSQSPSPKIDANATRVSIKLKTELPRALRAEASRL